MLNIIALMLLLSACSGNGDAIQQGTTPPSTETTPPSTGTTPPPDITPVKKSFTQPVTITSSRSVSPFSSHSLAFTGSETLVTWIDPLGGFVEFPALMLASIGTSFPTVSTLSVAGPIPPLPVIIYSKPQVVVDGSATKYIFINDSSGNASYFSNSLHQTIPGSLCNVRAEVGVPAELHLVTRNNTLSESYYSVSPDSGKSWTLPASIPDVGANCGQMTVAGKDAYLVLADNSGVRLVTVKNLGVGTILQSQVTDATGTPDSPAVDVSGSRVAVCWVTNQGELQMAQSEDGGVTFTTRDTILSLASGMSAETPQLIITSDGGMHIIIKTTSITDPAQQGISYLFSHDDGKSFSAPTSIYNGTIASIKPAFAAERNSVDTIGVTWFAVTGVSSNSLFYVTGN